MDAIQFKGLINGLLSVVKTPLDFDVVFEGMFVPHIKAFNDKYSTHYGMKVLPEEHKSATLSASDYLYIIETKNNKIISC